MRRLSLAFLFLLAACGEGRDPAAQGGDQPVWSGPAGGKGAAQPAGQLDRSRAGTAAPDTAFEDPDGEPATLADFRGRPVLLNLWATWCAPCIAEMPTLDALAGREGDRLAVLTVSQDLEGRDKVEAFFKARGYRHLETWLDPRMELMTALKVSTLPTTILYDAEGREVWRMAGIEDWAGPEAARLIAEAASPAAAR